MPNTWLHSLKFYLSTATQKIQQTITEEILIVLPAAVKVSAVITEIIPFLHNNSAMPTQLNKYFSSLFDNKPKVPCHLPQQSFDHFDLSLLGS